MRDSLAWAIAWFNAQVLNTLAVHNSPLKTAGQTQDAVERLLQQAFDRFLHHDIVTSHLQVRVDISNIYTNWQRDVRIFWLSQEGEKFLGELNRRAGRSDQWIRFTGP
jgi:hypothetical protein